MSISLLILAAALGSLLASKQKRAEGVEGKIIDWAWFVALAIAGVLIADDIHSTSNPNWYPVGQDWREFIVLALDIQSGGDYHPVPHPIHPP